jgi:hypothetical protein
VPIPYPNIGQLSQAEGVCESVLAGGSAVITAESSIPSSTCDEAGSSGGVKSGCVAGKVKFTSHSSSVLAGGKCVVRMLDSTEQNNGNAVGKVLGGNARVLVGD